MKKILLFIWAVLLPAYALASGLSLAGLFSDGMVLQRNAAAPIWGWADPGTVVTVSSSWSKTRYKTQADGDGRWEVSVDTPDAGGPYTLTVQAGKDRCTVKDVLIGEVWIFSGQSNMEDPVIGYKSQAVEEGLEEVFSASKFADKIRIFNVKEDTTNVLQKDVATRWKKASGPSVAAVSAIGWFFARRLHELMDVPVGLIANAWGGSNIEAWMSREALDEAVQGKIPEETLDKIHRRKNGRFPTKIAALWNGRMAPLAPYKVKGFVWYQGESNLKQPFYNLLQEGMVSLWRSAWRDDKAEMPFLFTLIAPFAYEKRNKKDGPYERPFFVENQLRSLTEIPNSYCACTETLGDETCIHPARKKPVADQFVLIAMERFYGKQTGVGSGFPTLKKIEFKDSSAVLLFETGGLGIGSTGKPRFSGFEIAGADRVYHPATARLKGRESVVVSSPEVPDPVAVRYGWRNYHEGNLANSLGIPVPCFRTDDWPK